MYKPNIFKRNFCAKQTQYQNRITKSSNSMKEMLKHLGLEETQHVSGPIKVSNEKGCIPEEIFEKNIKQAISKDVIYDMSSKLKDGIKGY